jgi:membrane-associated protease RseP (regulator of RpoE activity)
LPLQYLLNLSLFVLTFFTTTVAGVQWVNKDPFELSNFAFGLPYSLSILFILGTHELGHYFAARYHSVKATLPYFIPFPPLPFFLNFGTLGAVIRTRSVVPSRKVMFDIGIAGPLAGFGACIIVLVYGFLTLPAPSYILSIHPEYDFVINQVPGSEGMQLEFGQTLLFTTLANLLTDPSNQFVPPMSEIYHYPYLCVGWFGLFVTAMNLFPLGQFDGGHIIYTMFGDAHRKIARLAFLALLVLGLPSVLDSFARMTLGIITREPVAQLIPYSEYSWGGWFLWAMISYFIVKLYHPPVPDETPLDEFRMKLGYSGFAVFIVSFSFIPFTIPL